MKCPNCEKIELEPSYLESGLAAMNCNSCDGALLSLIAYRGWLESHPLDEQCVDADIAELAAKSEDTKHALHCPKCSSLMSKYRIGSDSQHRVDLCVACYEAWLDKGEWYILKLLNLTDVLPKIFTDQWQRKIQQDEFAQRYHQQQKKIFGESYQELLQFKRWLKCQDNSMAMINFLQRPLNQYEAEKGE